MAFKKGQSGNPNGRAPLPEDVKIKLRNLTPKALDTIERHMDSKIPAVAVKAAEIALSYNIPKAQQLIELTGADGGPILSIHVDKPPDETREQWLERKRLELACDN